MSSPTVPSRTPGIPRLANGDHLTRDEFERRYEAMPEVKKAELIEGVVYMPSPVRFTQHSTQHGHLLTWMGVYKASTWGVHFGGDATIRLDPSNVPQPDALLLIEPAWGGQATIDGDGYVVGGPELVAEVAASSVSIDRNTKLRVYRRNGIKEYILWRVEDEEIDWFILRGSQYDPLPLTAGVYRSEVFPGLWLDPAAMVRLDLAAVLAMLQQGLAGAEHAAFVAGLQQKAGNP
jgi:Uma2 family endonuclease